MKKDDRIYLNFIKQLLAESGQAELVREELSGESEALADGLEELGKYIKNEKNELEKICSTDALTGTGNRRAFNQIIDRLWEEKNPCAIGFIDIDGLKACNDNYGHSEGDRYIQLVSDKLRSCCKNGEYLFRMGGDEFLILTTYDNADGLSNRLLQSHFEFRREMSSKVEYSCDFSFGCVDIDAEKQTSVSERLSQADQKMYDFKIHNYMDHKHLQNYIPEADQNLDKSGLDNRIFEVFSKTASNRYTYICNMETNVSRWSAQAVRDFGLPSEYMYDAGTIWEEYIHPDDREAYRLDVEAVFSGKKPMHDLEYRARLKDGTYVRCTCEGCILRGRMPGEPDFFAGTLTNHGVLDHVDPITGCYNVYAFIRELRHRRNKGEGALFLTVGMNQYSNINNAFGYDIGDRALRKFAELLGSEIPGSKKIYRLDGVKFVIVLPKEVQSEVRKLFKIITDIAEKQIILDNREIVLSVSGASILLEHMAVSESIVLNELMILLREAKHTNSSELYVYNYEKTLEAHYKMELMETIKKSVLYGCEGFYLTYQPQVDRNSRITGVESLIRWKSEKYGVISPNQYIPWLEKDSCFYTLGLWILRNAVHETRHFLKERPDMRLSVNVSYRQFEKEKFIRDVLMILEEEDFPKKNLTLELTEHCQSMDPNLINRYIGEFHKHGIRISADDFGTGYSSFSLMKTLDFDCIKIDQSFIRNIMDQKVDQVMVESIIKCAKTLGLPVCVEGVETTEIFEFIKQYDPGFYQGYLFAKPLSISDLEQFMKECE